MSNGEGGGVFEEVIEAGGGSHRVQKLSGTAPKQSLVFLKRWRCELQMRRSKPRVFRRRRAQNEVTIYFVGRNAGIQKRLCECLCAI